MKYEIEIDLPADVLAKYEPVEVRRARQGDVYFSPSGKVSTWLPDFETANPLVILRPKATLDEWPVWLTAEAYAEDADGGKYFYEKMPTRSNRGWNGGGGIIANAYDLRFITNLTLPEYDGPWEHSLIRNPHLSKVEPAAVDTDKGRRDLFKVWHDGVFFSEYHDRKDAELCVSRHPDGDNCEIEKLRTVLSGDPDPDAAKWLIDVVERYVGNSGPPSYYYDVLAALAAAKGGE